MLAEDLRLGVALEAFRAWIPARDPAVRVKHVDGVIRDRAHQEAVALLVGDRRVLAPALDVVGQWLNSTCRPADRPRGPSATGHNAPVGGSFHAAARPWATHPM